MLKLRRALFTLSLVGLLFAGFVTTKQLIAPSSTPGVFSCVGLSIFGLSPCPYGLGLFAGLTVLTALVLWHTETVALVWSLRAVAMVGLAFSGWVVWREVCAPALARGPAYWASFSLARVPACAWGFLVFLAIGLLTWRLQPPPKPAS